MAKQGAALQTYNQELVKCIEDLKLKRTHIQQLIDKEEEEKASLVNEIEILSSKLKRIDESLSTKIAARAEFDRTINEAEVAYNKILESSQVLLSMVRREASSLEETLYENLDKGRPA